MAGSGAAATRAGRPRVVVVGAGAAGTLTAIHLLRAATRRATELDIVLVDPADRWARGVAFGTPDETHLLNVPSAGMSALPEDPGHFVAWRGGQERRDDCDPNAFVPRRQFALYLDDTLADARAAAADLVGLRHLRARAEGVRRTSGGCCVVLDDGPPLEADAVVIGTGLPTVGHGWAPEALRRSPFFVPDPWAPGALEVVRRDAQGPADVLVVGTGLTMVDVTLTLTGGASGGTRSGAPAEPRRVHAVSRHARLPRSHVARPRLAAIPDISSWGTTLAEIRQDATRHLAEVKETTGDWRPAVDGLRHRVTALWQRLTEAERLEFLATDAGAWNVLRHRMAPSSRARLDALAAEGRLTLAPAEVLDAEPLPGGGLAVTLSDGTRHDVGWVVNCTGPQSDVRQLGDPLLDDLLRPRAGVSVASIASGGMGFRTDRGRLVDSSGAADLPVWTLGALRRGELWESTAVPEIRTQASDLAHALLDVVAPLPRRLEDGRLVSGHHPVARPRDPLGLPLSTTAEAAAAYNAGLERIMRLQAGGEELIREATVLDRDFAVAHAALAMLGHEAGAEADVRSSLAAAQDAVEHRGDARERSFVDVVARRVADVRRTGAQALMSHVANHPRDVLAVSMAVPTIAFSGVTDVQQEAWDLVEGLAPAYRDHWWYISLLAFTRQDQGRFEEAGLLAESALSCEPSSGHAVHALTHVMYETGQHEAGRAWLDHWVRESGRSASHRAHFSWHAALHELAMGDTEAVRHRYYSQLAPPGVTGVRALVDSASLLWRWQVGTTEWFGSEGPPPPVEGVLEAAGEELVSRPQTPFVGLHAALGLAAAGGGEPLVRLRDHCAASEDPAVRSTVVAVCEALEAWGAGDWARAAETLEDVLPTLVAVGGSQAQREVVEETLLLALVRSGRAEHAVARLHERLDRRPSPLDTRRLDTLGSVPALT
ncbi:lycopene cyclase [Nocardioides sp. HDW12B]|uniref:FAD/NAD(P)-binding protein n=1 Tax=Nocardioides sp. HDW12B TaxID=2714939 RepID=UPI00140C2A78|nr:FAD/NAD(P)-binding protein [Nocardioides sp. HDW12B]QIK65904.1 lycopene cyclase [Nocardioides sp. HDW12B]